MKYRLEKWSRHNDKHQHNRHDERDIQKFIRPNANLKNTLFKRTHIESIKKLRKTDESESRCPRFLNALLACDRQCSQAVPSVAVPIAQRQRDAWRPGGRPNGDVHIIRSRLEIEWQRRSRLVRLGLGPAGLGDGEVAHVELSVDEHTGDSAVRVLERQCGESTR